MALGLPISSDEVPTTRLTAEVLAGADAGMEALAATTAVPTDPVQRVDFEGLESVKSFGASTLAAVTNVRAGYFEYHGGADAETQSQMDTRVHAEVEMLERRGATDQQRLFHSLMELAAREVRTEVSQLPPSTIAAQWALRQVYAATRGDRTWPQFRARLKALAQVAREGGHNVDPEDTLRQRAAEEQAQGVSPDSQQSPQDGDHAGVAGSPPIGGSQALLATPKQLVFTPGQQNTQVVSPGVAADP